MGWGESTRPKLSAKIGMPTPREGSDGDMQIKGTNTGAKFFAKWAGRWLGISDLIKSEEERKDVFIPKVWRTSLNTGTSTQIFVYLPEFITQANFITATTAVNLGTTLNFWFIWRNGAANDAQDALYRYLMYLDWPNRRLDISGFGSSTASYFQNTTLNVSVFFNG